MNDERLKEIKVGSIVKLSDMLDYTSGTVCVLHPYQNKLADKYPESAAINKYLEEIKFQASESYWSLVASTSGATNHYTFKRSKVLDIFATHGLKDSAAVALPANFEMAECTSFDRAALYKTTMNERVFVIFGSIK